VLKDVVVDLLMNDIHFDYHHHLNPMMLDVLIDDDVEDDELLL
jgi:hypothetical protein